MSRHAAAPNGSYKSSSLEHQLATLGLSRGDAEYPEGGRLDRNTISRVESAQVLSKKLMDREKYKQDMLEGDKQKRAKAYKNRQQKAQNWERRLQKSPFLVDLVGETERIDEENRVRLAREYRRQRGGGRGRSKPNEIILKALTEQSDLDALRAEKR
ncbi:unnamed protein product, partial [Heterosigma akashiwo]